MADAASLIAEYNKIEDHLSAQTKAFNEFCAPHKQRQEDIKNQLLAMLNELNAGKSDGKKASLSTDAGTAYLSTIATPKVVDKEKWLDWTLEDWTARGAMLQIGNPQKDAFNEYLDTYGQPPPFVEINQFTRVNIRRS